MRKTRAFARLLNRPKRKRLARFQVRILVVNKIKVTVVRETRGRFLFSEL